MGCFGFDWLELEERKLEKGFFQRQCCWISIEMDLSVIDPVI